MRIFAPLAHPFNTAAGLVKTMSAAQGNPGAQADVAGGMVRPFVENPSGEAVAAIPQAALALAGGGEASNAARAIEKGGPPGGAVGAAADAAAAAKAKLYPTSQSLSADISTARNLAKSLVVDPAGVNNFVKAATDETGTVVGYAQDHGIPINSKADFANAAKQTADEVQAHYSDNILGPNAQIRTAVPPNYRGVGTQGIKIGETPNSTPQTASLGDISNRIDAINQELNPNFRKGLASQTSAANVSDADLIAEKRTLTNILHDKLADATGLDPSSYIASVRQQAGKLRTIADEAQLSANRDLTAAGRQDAGGTTPSSVGTKQGAIDKGLQWVQGGAEVIGNRQILKALQNVAPKPLDLPQPAAPGAAAPGAAYNLWKSVTAK